MKINNMTIKEKAKAYDEAFRIAQELYNDPNSSNVGKGYVCTVFPKVKESEDDIRENCIAYIDGMLEAAIEKNDKEEIVELKKILAWLEKQRQVEESPISQHENKTCKENDDSLTSDDERIRKALISRFNESGELDGISYDNIRIWLEKQGEQKPADKVEPKFNIGDTIYNKVTKERCTITNRSLALQYYHDEDHLHEIRFSEQDDWEIIKSKFHEGEWITNGDYTWKIVEVKSLDYILQSQNGNIVDDTISHIDKQFHSFTIEDAKDGDVLIYNHQPFKWIFIFKRLYSPIIVSYYVMFTEKNKIYIDDSISTNFLSKITPATKEQRDLLFKKMKEAGYEFDFEKKELKKIEQKQVIDYPDSLPKDNWELIHEFINKFGRIPKDEDELNVLIEYVLKRQKPAWSEEDTETLNGIANYLFTSTDVSSIEGSDKWYDWLKSLKDRVQPKQEWDEEDERIYKSITYSFANNYPLTIQQQEFVKSLRPQKLHVYNPYKAVVESIAKMCDKYENCMCDEEEAKDFLANVAVKCREAAEYDKQYMEE